MKALALFFGLCHIKCRARYDVINVPTIESVVVPCHTGREKRLKMGDEKFSRASGQFAGGSTFPRTEYGVPDCSSEILAYPALRACTLTLSFIDATTFLTMRSFTGSSLVLPRSSPYNGVFHPSPSLLCQLSADMRQFPSSKNALSVCRIFGSDILRGAWLTHTNRSVPILSYCETLIGFYLSTFRASLGLYHSIHYTQSCCVS